MPRYLTSTSANSALETVSSGRKSASPASEYTQDIYPLLQAETIAFSAKLSSASVGREPEPPEKIAIAQSVTANTDNASIRDKEICFFILLSFRFIQIYKSNIAQYK